MDQEKVGKFIAQLRRERGMTQEKLGERLGVTNKTVSRWETGRYMPDVDKLLELSELLGVSVNELLSGERLETPERAVEKAEENLISVLSQSDTFGLADRIEYFKHKWLSEHKFDIGLTVILYLAAVTATLVWVEPAVLAAVILLGVGLYGLTRNRMMAYVEARAFGGADGKEERQGNGNSSQSAAGEG